MSDDQKTKAVSGTQAGGVEPLSDRPDAKSGAAQDLKATSASEPKTASTPAAKPPHDELTFGTTPNILTMIRIGFVPLVVGALFFRTHAWDVAAALLFTAASITDYFDGYIARTQKLETIYGKLLDPLADKFLVVSSLVMLQYLDRLHPVFVILLICRELAITGLRALASAEGVIIAASDGGKWKTVFQMVAIPFMMTQPGIWGIPMFAIGEVLLYLSLGLSLWSAKSYAVGFFRRLQELRKERAEQRKMRRSAKRISKAVKKAAKRAVKNGEMPPY